MAFSEDMISKLRGDSLAEIGVLLAAAGAAPGAPVPPRAPDPDRLFDLARLNKMLGWLPVSPAALPPGCAGLAPRLLQVRLQTMAMNRHAMAVTAEAVAALRRAGVAHVVLKGPFQQIMLHGDPFRRPSGDIDLYVAPRARRRAADVLHGLGFAAMEPERAIWWIPFLGEQHFRRAADGAVIDLHHRLQQAGLPDWRGAEAVLERAVTLHHEGADIPVLSPPDGCLLMAGTLAKALLAHEPCGAPALELPRWLARLDPAGRARLDRVAAASGQDLTLALGVALARACDPGGDPAGDSVGDSAGQPGGHAPEPLAAEPAVRRRLPADPAVLRDLVFQPWQRPAEAPRRRQMLRMLTQGRPHVLALEAARIALSDRVRMVVERRGTKRASQ